MSWFLALGLVITPSAWAADTPRNLAREATASASEALNEELAPAKATDGNAETRWSGVPGHNAGVWYQLEWKEPVQVGEVFVHQYDRFVMELDVQVRKAGAADWETVQHFGKAGERLPLLVVCRFAPVKVTGLRIGNITNGPSFTEVEVYDRPYATGIGTTLASDLRGNFIGMVCDSLGVSPVENAEVRLAGTRASGPWRCEARSDNKGLFFAPMPVGLKGTVTVETQYPKAAGARPAVHAEFDAVGFQYGLTPRGMKRAGLSLNGEWKFMLDPPTGFERPDFDDSQWAKINVPSHWEMEGFHSDEGVGGYRVRFAAPEGPGRAKLRFEGVYSGAEVWVNGRLVATHEGGATPFEADVTEALSNGPDNVLALRVKEHTVVSDKLDHMSLYAYFSLAGIIRDVSILRVAEVHIAAVEVTTELNKDQPGAIMTVTVRVINESAQAFQGRQSLVLTDTAGNKVDIGDGQLPAFDLTPGGWVEVKRVLSLPKTPKTWDAEHPNLYYLTLQLQAGEKTTDEVVLRTGFRQTEIRGSEILINGRPVKFRGTCHHDSHPLMGRAVTADLQRQDLKLMKEANLNAVRTSHYPPTPELLDMADELGLYVEDEASFCWARDTNDLRNTPRILQLEAELLARDRNHPSVAFWSICNESEFGYGFERAHEWVRATDPSRPCSAATSAWLEIATLHNPLAISRIDEHEKLDKPLLFDESLCIFQGIFGDVAEMWVDPGVRDYYAQPQPEIYARFMKSQATQGSYIWCWADDIFCVPGRGYEYGRYATRSHFLENSYRIDGRGLVGDAPWGVVDGWRRKKPEFWTIKKLHSPVKVKETSLSLPKAREALKVAVENQYDFTNLSEVKIVWMVGDNRGEARVDVAPRSSGLIEIGTLDGLKDGDALDLMITDAANRMIDAYHVPIGTEPARQAKFLPCAPAELKILAEESLAEPCTAVNGKEFRLGFDKKTGLLRRGVIAGRPVMFEYPKLHVLPTNRPLGPLPDVMSWQCEKLETRPSGEGVHVSISGKYKDFRGGYEIEISPDGTMVVEASFENTGEEILAREVGLRFSVARETDVLEWERKGEWNVYPGDHIGRPRGTAPAFSGRVSGAPPKWAWSQDDSPMGSNDFRSTKRHVYWAGIHYADGPGVGVISDGSQHVRAAVASDRINVHVIDWYGGTNAGWWEWVHNYSKGKLIKHGEMLKSKVTLKLAKEFESKVTAKPDELVR